MRLKTSLIFSLFTAATLGGWSSPARAAAPAGVVLETSVRTVAQSAANGNVDTRRPFISRATLKASESAAPMTLELPLRMRNLAELEARVAKGERISPQELAQKYLPTAQDYQTVVAWAKSQGLPISRQDDHHLAVFVRASVGKIAGVLKVNFARVTSRGQEFTSAINAPTVPAALSGVIQGITGLQPHLRPHKHSIKLANPAAAGGGYTPAQIAAAYNVTPLYTGDIDGSGQTIAISIDTFPSTTDLEKFWTAYNIKQSISNIQFIQTVPGTMYAPSGEESIDTEWSSSIAPGAHVRVYGSTDLSNVDLDTQYQQIIDDVTNHPELNIHAMSMSYGSQETDTDAAELENDDGLFATLASQGVSIFASSGDGGSCPSDDQAGDDGSLQPENPADDPEVAGVGGTSLHLNSNGTVASETVWNDIPSGGASGGGISGTAEPSNSSFTGFDRPSWQTGTGVNTSAKRQVPDLAATADPDYGGAVVVNGSTVEYGGTSLASPICAAIFSLVNEARANAGQSPLGLVGPHIYPLNGASTPSFTDVKFSLSNNNYNSQDPASEVNGVREYSAETGYDCCTGVGTPLGQQLAKALVGSSTLVGVKYPAVMEEVTPGGSTSFSVAVSGASATYQWQRQAAGTTGFSNLSNGSGFSGAQTATLTITNATTTMSGDQFQCVVTLPSATITTAPPSNLAVETPLAVSALAGVTGLKGRTNGTGTGARFNYPSGIALDNGNLYVADWANNQIREVTAAGAVTTPFGSTSAAAGSANGNGNSATFNGPNAIVADSSGDLYIADANNNAVRKITGTSVTTLSSAFNAPEGIAVNSSTGDVYVADTGNDTIDVIHSNGSEAVYAGQTGSAGFQDGATSGALFNAPEAVAVDSSGNVWVADLGNSAIREISGGSVTTVAGTGGVAGYVDGPAKSALFNGPTGLSFDSSGNLYITDSLIADQESGSNQGGNCLIRRLSTAGVVTTLAGDPGYAGSATGSGSAAQFYSIQAVIAVSGGLYVCDTYNQLLRAVGSPTTTGGSSGGGSVVSFSGLSATYDGSSQAATATTTPANLPVTITYSSSTYGPSTTPPTNAGSYTVTAVVNDPPYSGTATGTFVIAKATAAVTLGDLSATYDGSAHAATATTTPSGLTVNLTYGNSATPPVNTGTYTVTATVADTNYTGSATGSLVISPAAATLTLENLNATYTGKAIAVTAVTAPTGLPVVITYNSSTVAPTAVGSYNVNARVNSPNYSATATGTLTISPATATITLTGLTAVYNGKTHPVTATTVPAKLPVTLLYSSNTYPSNSVAPSAIGSYTVNASVSTTDYVGTATATLNITPIPPTVVTGAVSGVTSSGANLIGSSDPEGSTTTLAVQYGPTATYTATTSAFSIGNGTTSVTIAVPVSGLAAGTTYHYRAVASSAGGTVYGADKTFLTLGPNYSVAGQAYVAAAGAQLSFSINPNGVATSVYFIYSTNSNFSTFSQTATQSLGAGKVAVSVSAFLSGLAANTTYYYKAVITSAAGTFTSPVQQFTTSGFDTTLVAATGSLAPDTAYHWATLGNAAVDHQDDAAFRATLTGAAATANTGIWANLANTGSLVLVAQIGSAAPGANGTPGPALFSVLMDPVFNNNGDVAFGATLKVATGTVTAATENGIWASSSGTLSLLAREGSPAPGITSTGSGTVTFASFGPVGLSDDNGAIVSGTLTVSTTTGVTAANNAGVWEGSTSNDLTLMLRAGETTNTGKIIASFKFLPTETFVNGQTRGFGPATGDLTALATYTDKTTGILEVIDAGTPLAVATSGGIAAGTGSATFLTFSNPAINDGDQVAFESSLKGGDTTTRNAGGIWTGDSTGTLQLIARLGQVAPGTGSSAVFTAFNDPVDNVNDVVAFRATLSVGTGAATAANDIGLWRSASGSLTLAARIGTQAPGCATGITISAITEMALDDVNGADGQGGVIFLATLAGTGVTAANNTAIFAQDNTGQLQLIVRTGDVLNGKTVSTLAFLPAEPAGNGSASGQGRSVAPTTGDLIYNATFTDKSQAIFNVVFQ